MIITFFSREFPSTLILPILLGGGGWIETIVIEIIEIEKKTLQ